MLFLFAEINKVSYTFIYLLLSLNPLLSHILQAYITVLAFYPLQLCNLFLAVFMFVLYQPLATPNHLFHKLYTPLRRFYVMLTTSKHGAVTTCYRFGLKSPMRAVLKKLLPKW